ncbi:MAG: NFACT family protein, partial [Monoglobaceae bacterium]
ESLAQAAKKEKYKIYGDLLTANIYKIKFGMKNITVENYYSDNCELIEIKLDETKSPSQNAQRYYKKYNKLKTAELFATEQIEEAEKEKYYLESVAEALENVENSAELDDIRAELEQEGYIKSANTKKKKNQIKSAPLRYMSSDGYEILVGRNNRQNDELTIRMAYSTDLWFHTKQIPGSHTIVRTKGEKDIPETTILEAAKLAAYHSKAKNSSQVPVDYTIIKNVKKPNGAKPGMVIYDSYNTLYVLPETL